MVFLHGEALTIAAPDDPFRQDINDPVPVSSLPYCSPVSSAASLPPQVRWPKALRQQFLKRHFLVLGRRDRHDHTHLHRITVFPHDLPTDPAGGTVFADLVICASNNCNGDDLPFPAQNGNVDRVMLCAHACRIRLLLRLYSESAKLSRERERIAEIRSRQGKKRASEDGASRALSSRTIGRNIFLTVHAYSRASFLPVLLCSDHPHILRQRFPAQWLPSPQPTPPSFHSSCTARSVVRPFSQGSGI